jgi:hypothetical protein
MLTIVWRSRPPHSTQRSSRAISEMAISLGQASKGMTASCQHPFASQSTLTVVMPSVRVEATVAGGNFSSARYAEKDSAASCLGMDQSVKDQGVPCKRIVSCCYRIVRRAISLMSLRLIPRSDNSLLPRHCNSRTVSRYVAHARTFVRMSDINMDWLLPRGHRAGVGCQLHRRRCGQRRIASTCIWRASTQTLRIERRRVRRIMVRLQQVSGEKEG